MGTIIGTNNRRASGGAASANSEQTNQTASKFDKLKGKTYVLLTDGIGWASSPAGDDGSAFCLDNALQACGMKNIAPDLTKNGRFAFETSELSDLTFNGNLQPGATMDCDFLLMDFSGLALNKLKETDISGLERLKERLELLRGEPKAKIAEGALSFLFIIFSYFRIGRQGAFVFSSAPPFDPGDIAYRIVLSETLNECAPTYGVRLLRSILPGIVPDGGDAEEQARRLCAYSALNQLADFAPEDVKCGNETMKGFF